MRQKKFRGQRLDNRQWVYGYYAEFDDCFDGKISTDYFIIDGRKMNITHVIPETVGQLLPIEQVDDKEFYEGDIVLLQSNFGPQKIVMRYGISIDPKCQPIVIGNLHENPELFESKNGN